MGRRGFTTRQVHERAPQAAATPRASVSEPTRAAARRSDTSTIGTTPMIPKNVAPAALEDPIRANPIVGQVVVVGDQKPFISALVTLDPEMLPTWLANNGLPGDMSLKDAAANPKVREEVQRAIDIANKSVSRAESIRKFTILDTEWTEASGHLTPKLSIKRNVIMQDFADAVDELYNVPVNTTNVALGG